MVTLNIPRTDPRTERIIRLLAELATDAPPFMQPFEREPWLEKQVGVFLTLYRQYQGNPRVRNFLAEVDGGSRTDHSVEDAVWRARRIARTYLEGVLRDIEEANNCPTAPKTGDPAYDQWSDDRQVVSADGFGSEWKRQAVREGNRQVTHETDFRGYVSQIPIKRKG